MATLSVRAEAGAIEEMSRAHRQLGAATAVAGAIAAVVAPIIRIELSIVSLVGTLGVLIGAMMVVRAQRTLARPAGVTLELDGAVASARHDDGAALVQSEPVMAGQAFTDHVQLVVGSDHRRLVQLELPLSPADRARLLAHLGGAGVVVAERRSVARHLALALTLVPAGVIAAYLAYRAIVLLALYGVVAGLAALGPEAGLGGFAVLAALGMIVLVAPRSRPPGDRW